MEYRATRAGVSAFVPCPLFGSRLLGTLSRLLCGEDGEERGAGAREGDYSGRRVLLVEDNELNLEIASELLSMTGVEVDTAENGLQAAERFAAVPEGYYDIIFMDIQMPVMDGYEAARRIRSLDRPDAGTVWIVAMTANAFEEDKQTALKCGMNGHISKPIDIAKLLKTLENLLKRTAGGIAIIDDAYNSNPAGAKMALEVLREFRTEAAAA